MAQIRVTLAISRWLILAYAFNNFDALIFGSLAAALSILEIARVISDLGLEPLVYLKSGGNNQKLNKIWGGIFLIKILSSIIAMIIMLIIAIILNKTELILSAFVLPVWAANVLLMSLVQKYKKTEKIPYITGVIFISGVALGLFLLNNLSPENLMAILIMPDLICTIGFAIILSKKFSEIKISIFEGFGKIKIIGLIISKKAAKSFLIQLMSSVIQRADVVIVLPILGYAAQAKYSAAYRFTEPILQMGGIFALGWLINSLNSNKSTFKINSMNLLNNKKVRAAYYAATICAVVTILVSIYMNFSNIDNDFLLIAMFIAIMPVRIINIFASTILTRLERFNLIAIGTTLSFTVIMLGGVILNHKDTIYITFGIYCLGELINSAFQFNKLKSLVMQ